MQQIGRYQILGELGRGAMGVVYRAQDPAIGRIIAIKTIRLSDLTEAAERERLRERLFREAQSAGMLSHPNIVTIYDIAEESGMAYVFMEFVNGPSLDKLLDDKTLQPQQLMQVLQQTASALDYAHRKGIVHRDIKPANLMIHEDGQAKITDFGVAKIQSQQMTLSGAMMGTPNYMSPEQVQGQPVDGRADQFGLAVIAYETLTGEKPFSGDYLPTLLYKIVRDDPMPAQRINSTLSPQVDTVLRRALAKKPAERYESCGQFVGELRSALDGKPGWRTLPRGASENMATMAGHAASPELVAPARGRDRVLPSFGPENAPSAEVAAAPRKSGILRNVVLALMGIGILGLLLLAAQTFLWNKNEPAGIAAAAQPSTSAPEHEAPPEPTLVKKSPFGQVTPDPDAQPSADRETVQRPPQGIPAAPVSPTRDDAARMQTAQLLTDPPGAQLVIDGRSDLACKTPCMLSLANGRHTLRADLDGYRETQKVFNTPQDKDLLFKMDRKSGTLHVTSDPAGATISLNGAEQAQKTPATIALPAGAYKLEIVNGGRRWEGQIDIHDGEFKSVEW